MARIDIDIDTQVATGITGVKAVLTAFNNFLPVQANFHPRAKIRAGVRESMWAFEIYAPNGEDYTVERFSYTIPAALGRVYLGYASAIASGDSDTTDNPTIRLYKNGTTLGTITTTTKGTRAEAQLNAWLYPGDVFSVAADTNNGGSDVYDRACVEVHFSKIGNRKGSV